MPNRNEFFKDYWDLPRYAGFPSWTCSHFICALFDLSRLLDKSFEFLFFLLKKSSKRWISITLALISKKKIKKKTLHWPSALHIQAQSYCPQSFTKGLLRTLQLWGLVWAHLIKMVSNLWTKQLQLGPNKAGPYYHMAAIHWPDDYRTRWKTSVRTPRVNYQLV